ncbi:MAG: NYN domain-containing protein [Phycisphaerae bacterium]|nr:NYN domain-containing protein [Phycisphaerae bacterium]
MPVLVDGDNLLHVFRGELPDAERANRARLCELLAAWDADRTRQVTVTFDGYRPGNPGEGPIGVEGLQIRYSDAVTADELIVEALQASTAPRRLLVVSSDRQVRLAAKRRRAVSVDSRTFLQKVLDELDRRARRPPREPSEKYEGLEPGQTDYWLDQFGIEPEGDDARDEFGLLD